METISEVINQQSYGQRQPPLSPEVTSSANYDGGWQRCDPEEIEVPQEAIDAFVAKYKIEEAARRNRIRYNEHLQKAVVYPAISSDRFYDMLLNQGLTVDDYNRQLVEALVLYFAGDERAEHWGGHNISLKKGIMLTGNIGCGKTFLMNLLRINPTGAYLMKSCRDIADEYKTHGVEGIQKYSSLRQVSSRNPMNGSDQFGWCFDDLGTEDTSANFGNRANVMEQVILSAYDRVETRGRIHLTTNLTASEIEAKYGSRVRSRMREMFNIVSFPSNAVDRRQ